MKRFLAPTFITGLIAAPIFYAYFKEELREKGLV